MDEAHKTVGDGEKLFSHLLHDKNLPIRRRLFMTATERRYKGQSDTVLSMDDPATYGETFHLLSFKRAMEYDPPILSDYKIISIAVSREEVAELIRKNTFVRPDKGPWNKEIEADMLASLIALRKAMNKYPIHHAVSFHGSIQRAELFKIHNDAFSKSFRKYGKLETFHVSGKTPTGTRARIIGEFARAERALISNARCLTEGVDVPGIDCVLFADPRRSAVDIVQAVGRALRPAPNKMFGYVIVPILHDADATAEDIFQSAAFKEILTTLRALAANDDRIIEYFRGVSQGQQRKGGGSVQFDIDERLAKRINLADFAREIELKCWDKLAKLSWREYDEAREFVHRLKIKSQTEWFAFCKGTMPQVGVLPPDIPYDPRQTYIDRGWKGYGDWLGTGAIAPRLRKYRSFHEARTFVRTLNLKNQIEWFAYCKGEMPELGRLPLDIPAVPRQTYADRGWKGYGDWLGTGNIANFLKVFKPFVEARDFACKLNLKSSTEWRSFCKGEMPKLGRLPSNIPSNPQKAYADKGWKSMGDWLGTRTIAPQLKEFRPFCEARAFVHKLDLENAAEWRVFCKGGMPQLGRLPADIPIAPEQQYLDKGWIDWGDWLGTGSVSNARRQFRSFHDARAFARSLKLKSGTEWRAFYKREMPMLGQLPVDIPTAPSRTYAKEGWKGMGDWLGTGNVASYLREYRPFSEARAYVRDLKLKSGAEWISFRRGKMPELGRLPADIPANPEKSYADKGWKGMGDWLGTGNIAPSFREFLSFPQARTFARSLNLKNLKQWCAFCKGDMPELGKLPVDIPSKPGRYYEDKGWNGLGDWLGTGNVSNRFKKSQ
jgi:hypothetical protein